MAVGIRPVGSAMGLSTNIRQFNAAGTFAANDLVNLNNTGELVLAGGGDFIMGTAIASATATSSNVPVNVTGGLMIIADNDNDSATFAASFVGGRIDITGNSGEQVVDTSTLNNSETNPSGQLVVLAYNPQGFGHDTDTSVGLFAIAEGQLAFNR